MLGRPCVPTSAACLLQPGWHGCLGGDTVTLQLLHREPRSLQLKSGIVTVAAVVYVAEVPDDVLQEGPAVRCGHCRPGVHRGATDTPAHQRQGLHPCLFRRSCLAVAAAACNPSRRSVDTCLPISQVLFYCHFPDLLLARPRSRLHAAYRRPLDWAEQTSTGAADCIVVNSEFTKGDWLPDT